MPRYPDIDSKTTQLILKAKPGQEDKIRWFKKWCVLNGKQISEILYEKVEDMARVHGYPDGHSQASLDFAETPKMLPFYRTCRSGADTLVKGEFFCKDNMVHLTPEICVLRRGNREKHGHTCYQER